MIDKLKFLLDQFENNEKIKNMLLSVAKMPESSQETALKLIELIINIKNGNN
jgi:hypothetical protein